MRDPKPRKPDPVAMAAKQLERLDALVAAWTRDLRDRTPGLRLLADCRGEARASALEILSDEDETLDDDGLKGIMIDRLERLVSDHRYVEDPTHRLEQYYDDHPKTESSDEMTFLSMERDLAQAIDTQSWTPGSPSFDAFLFAWERLSPSSTYDYGFHEGIRSTLVGLLPAVRTHLALTAGKVAAASLLGPLPLRNDNAPTGLGL